MYEIFSFQNKKVKSVIINRFEKKRERKGIEHNQAQKILHLHSRAYVKRSVSLRIHLTINFSKFVMLDYTRA